MDRRTESIGEAEDGGVAEGEEVHPTFALGEGGKGSGEDITLVEDKIEIYGRRRGLSPPIAPSSLSTRKENPSWRSSDAAEWSTTEGGMRATEGLPKMQEGSLVGALTR